MTSFFAAVQSRHKVELVFSSDMLQNADFVDPLNYTITDLESNSIAIGSVTPSGPAPISRATLALETDLSPSNYYIVTIDSAVKDSLGFSVSPLTYLFQWVGMPVPTPQRPLAIPIGHFSGEVTSGLLGLPAGQVFFSPALETASSSSTIQVDSVSVCTKAYDEYHFPELRDPQPFFTFQSGFYSSRLNEDALWASAERQGLSRVNLTDSQADSVLIFDETICAVFLEEPIDITYGGFLNDDRWGLYDGVVQSFTVYDNIAHGGPGPSIYQILIGVVSEIFDFTFDYTFD